jgi:hypothetical protein
MKDRKPKPPLTNDRSIRVSFFAGREEIDPFYGEPSQPIVIIKNRILRRIDFEDHSQLWEFKDRHPSKAMQDHPIWRKYPLVKDILNTLEAKRIVGRKKDFIFLFSYDKQKYRKRYGKRSYPYAAFKTDDNFYKTMLPVLEISHGHLQKHLAELHRAGILILLEKEGIRHHLPVYAAGYFMPSGYRLQFMPFLKIENMDILDKFRPQFSRK